MVAQPADTSVHAFPTALQGEVDAYLTGLRFSRRPETRRLEDAMRYSVLGAGKRVRPVLVLASARALGLDHTPLLPLAAAIELLHNFSLIHDDLPAMDDDNLRRGRPANHRVFGEGVAILAGDALFAESIVLLHAIPAPPERVLAAADAVARAVATDGMAGGQYVDLAGSASSRAEVLTMHRMKTGRLIEACVTSVLALADPPRAVDAALRTYGAELGHLFQVVDDILDLRGGDGKTPGSDARNARRTVIRHADAGPAEGLADVALSRIEHVLGDLAGDASELLAIAHLVHRRARA